MTIIEQIKAEIERLYDGEAPKHDQQCDFNDGYFVGIDAIAQFIDSLELEKPNQDGLEEEIKRYYDDCDGDCRYAQTARHFAKWGAEHAKIDVTDFCKPIDPGIAQCIADHSWEMLGEDEKSFPNDLEEAAEEYEKKHTYQRYDGGGLTPEYDATLAEAVIAGAVWQKDQDEKNLSEKIAAAYQLGLADKEKQMMSEAVEGTVAESYGYEKKEDGEWGQVVSPIIRINVEKYSLGDKVRVIVLPKED